MQIVQICTCLQKITLLKSWNLCGFVATFYFNTGWLGEEKDNINSGWQSGMYVCIFLNNTEMD